MESAAAWRSPLTSVRSLASIATAVPVPIARPRSAWASAGPSLTRSPTIATTLPDRRCAVEGFRNRDGLGVEGVVEGHAVVAGRRALLEEWGIELSAELRAALERGQEQATARSRSRVVRPNA